MRTVAIITAFPAPVPSTLSSFIVRSPCNLHPIQIDAHVSRIVLSFDIGLLTFCCRSISRSTPSESETAARQPVVTKAFEKEDVCRGHTAEFLGWDDEERRQRTLGRNSDGLVRDEVCHAHTAEFKSSSDGERPRRWVGRDGGGRVGRGGITRSEFKYF